MSIKKGSANHHLFMRQALTQARRAVARDEVPVGAVVVNDQGVVIARAFNQTERKKTQAAHAEILALTKAGRKLGDWRLEGCWLYVTLEPCAMCFNLAVLSRVRGIVFGAKSPLFGYRLDRLGTVSLYKDGRLPREVVEGVEAEQAMMLLKGFFKKKRKSSE